MTRPAPGFGEAGTGIPRGSMDPNQMKISKIFVLLTCAMTLTAAAFSQSWVSNAGSDTNICSLTSPCKTLQHAVDVTGAWGQVGVLNAGDYGPATITKSIRIDGGGLLANVAFSGDAITVNTLAGDVVQLRNLSLHGHGASNGIRSTGAGALDIDNVQVTGFTNDCIGVSGNGPFDIVIKDTTAENCAVWGISMGPSEGTLTGKIINTHVRFANFGLLVLGGQVSVYDSTFSSPGLPDIQFSNVGMRIDAGSSVLAENCKVTGFLTGVLAAASATVQFNNSSFFNNRVALVPFFGSIISNGNNAFFFNGTNGTFSQTVALQ
jgi:hypothetical protein